MKLDLGSLFKKKAETVAPLVPASPALIKQPCKPATQSLTIQSGLVAILAGFLLSITPSTARIATRAWPGQAEAIQDYQSIANELLGLVVFLSGGGAVVGRFRAGGLYTPAWLPGPNKEEQ